MRLVPSFRATSREARKRSDANGDIGPLLHQVDQYEIERDVWMFFEETRDLGHHVQHAKGDVAVDRQTATRRGAGSRFTLGLLHFGEDAHGVLVEHLAFLSEGKLASSAIDQP
jgi:hypothetical protein